MSHPALRSEQRGAVTVLTLDRPPVNALDLETMDALVHAVEHALAHHASAIVLTGREGAFSAGLDVKAIRDYGRDEQRRMVRGVNHLCRVIYGAQVPTVAAVSGHAIGGGLILALTCDQRIGADRPSVYSLPEARAGVPFPVGAMAVLRAELSPAAARRLALCDMRMDAAEAMLNGVLDRVVPPERLLDAAVEAAEQLASLPRRAFLDVKNRLRAEALDAFQVADPHLDAWI